MNLDRNEVNILFEYFQNVTYAELRDKGILQIMNKLCNSKDTPDSEDWHKKVVDFLFHGQKIHAIKLVREKTGYSLKSSKDICDKVCHKMSIICIHWQQTYHTVYDQIFLNDEESKLVDILVQIANRY